MWPRASSLLAIAACSVLLNAQQSADPNPVRFEPNLVQVDAAIVDSQGNPVPDLKPEDLRVTQDNKAKKLSAFSYIKESAPRTVVLMVNDCDMDAANLVRVRDALHRFIDERLSQGDKVALVNTSGGSRYLGQFTSSRHEFQAAIDDLHWRPPLPYPLVAGRIVDNLRKTIAALADLPGRKSLIIVSDNWMPGSFSVRALADSASRASVVIHTIDPSATPSTSVLENFLKPLSEATGGIVRPGRLDLAASLRDVADAQASYYLAGWDPGPALRQIWGWPVYHRLEIKSLRPGLTVRTRSGFFGVSGPLAPPNTSSKMEQILVTLSAPLKPQSVFVRVTPLAVTHGDEVSIRSFIHVGAGIELIDNHDGCYTASLTIYSSPVRMNDDSPNQQLNTRSAKLHLCGKIAQDVRELGLVCTIEDKVPAPGAYRVNVGVRNGGADPESLSAEKSNTLIRRADWKQEVAQLGTATALVETAETLYLRGEHAPSLASTFRTLSEDDPALRDFHPGDKLVYDAPAGAQFQILRDGEPVDSGNATGSYLLKPSLAAGQYILRLPATNQWTDFRVVASPQL